MGFMTDAIRIIEVITPNARELQGVESPTFEVHLSRPLTDWEELVFQERGYDVSAHDTRLLFTPRGPYTLASLVSAINSLIDAASNLEDQHEARASQILDISQKDAPGVIVRQAIDYGAGVHGQRR